jgi:hypothetical protein
LGSAFAQRCKLRIEIDTHVESKILVLLRGGIVAMGTRFGIKAAGHGESMQQAVRCLPLTRIAA